MVRSYSNDTLAEVRLASVSGVGPLTRKRLIDAFGDARAALDADSSRLTTVQGVGPKLAQAITQAPDDRTAEQQLGEAHQAGIYPLSSEDRAYPPRLHEVYDAPSILYCRGEVLLADERAVAIVGTRRATRYGLRQAEAIARGLAQAGITVVSGLARGIDAAAHSAAIQAGGRTLAVLAGGLMKIYPPEHDRLADQVAMHGALLAESPPHMPPMSGSFPQRNRIISGISLGVVVIEAAERSGALITARHAAEQGRDAFAIPGPIDSLASAGCHRLIQEGAKLVVSVDDILEELESLPATVDDLESTVEGPLAESSAQPRIAIPQLTDTEQKLWDVVGTEPMSIDQVVDQADLPIERVLSTLSMLEARGLLRRISGSLVSRA